MPRCSRGTKIVVNDRFINGVHKIKFIADVLHIGIERLNIPEVILFGHSNGGSIALLVAAGFFGKIKDVITEGAYVFVEDITREGIEKEKNYIEIRT